MSEIDKEQVMNDLNKGICQVVFTKVNGDTRIMRCTLEETMLPQQIDIEESIQKKKPNPDVVSVWDIEAQGWRSFRWDSVKEFKAEFNL